MGLLDCSPTGPEFAKEVVPEVDAPCAMAACVCGVAAGDADGTFALATSVAGEGGGSLVFEGIAVNGGNFLLDLAFTVAPS